MSTAHMRTRRFPWFRGTDNVWTRSKRYSEVLNEEIEFIGELDGETLLTVTITSSGPTVSAEVIASGRDGTNTKVTYTVTGSGDYDVKVTTSGGRTLIREFFLDSSDSPLSSRYRA